MSKGAYLKPQLIRSGQFDKIIGGFLTQLHFEVVMQQRWDITPTTRKTLSICLN
jgi:hypothetical protein